MKKGRMARPGATIRESFRREVMLGSGEKGSRMEAMQVWAREDRSQNKKLE